MRRPTLCGSGARPLDQDGDDDEEVAYLHRRPGGRTTTTTTTSSASAADASQGRLSRVRRLLADSLLGARRAPAAPAAAAAAAAGSSSAAASRSQFGIPLSEVALTKEGVPVVVVKICGYLENNGLQCESLFQSRDINVNLAERMRTSLDLEAGNDVYTTALLLKYWLKELPEPIVPAHVAAELLVTHGKVCDEPVGTWRQAVRLVLCTLPETNLRLLRYILRFLHRYNHHQQQRLSNNNTKTVLTHLGATFAPLLLLRDVDYYGAEELSRAHVLTSRLIQDHASVFHQWLLDHPSGAINSAKKSSPNSHQKDNQQGGVSKDAEDTENKTTGQHRKRKERNESSNSSQSLERKVIRSSSEERRLELSVAKSKNESIRRVSSHEDFSHVKKQMKASGTDKKRFSTVQELCDQPSTLHFNGLPLQECNHIESSQPSKDVPLSQNSLQKENEILNEQMQSFKMRERSYIEVLDDEHERRRSSERFSRSLIPPRSVARRNIGRKKRCKQSSSTSVLNASGTAKEKEDFKQLLSSSQSMPQSALNHHSVGLPPQQSLSSEEQDDDADPEAEVESLSDESRPGSSHSFLQLHPPERERSPSPSISPCTPPLDLSTLHQSVDGSEPIASRAGWDFARSQNPEEDPNRGILLSPRNSMILTRRVFIDHNVPPSPPGDHHGSCLPGPALDLENMVKKLNKQSSSIKKKLKRYEEGFEKEFGYRPSQSDKMANIDIKKMCFDLSRIRKEIKQIKDNPLSAMANHSAEISTVCAGMTDQKRDGQNPPSIEETVAEVERRLKEKREMCQRPESIDEMTPEQHAAEKLAMQKALLMLEKLCGRATSKQDREIVRPLYDRYRQLKRIVARATSLKLKDSINELATIHEHEAMDFTPSASLTAMPDGGHNSDSSTLNLGSGVGKIISSLNTVTSGANATLQTQPSTEETSDSQTSSSDSLVENLHALPLSDLVLQLTQTRDEKKKLRRLLREQEEQFQQRTGRRMQREDRASLISEASTKDYSILYTSYKQVKAKLRLLEALVAKQR